MMSPVRGDKSDGIVTGRAGSIKTQGPTGDAVRPAMTHCRAYGQGPRNRGRRHRRGLRRCLPAGAGSPTAAQLAAAARRGHGGRGSSRDRGFRCTRRYAPARCRAAVRLVHRGDDRAVGRGRQLLPADLRRRRGCVATVHILMFGWREGKVGMRMAALLQEKLAEGVEVRGDVDGFGSRPYKQAREMFTGPLGRSADRRQRRLPPTGTAGTERAGSIGGRTNRAADHRKLYVIDGQSPGRVGLGSRTTSRTAASMTSWLRITATSSAWRRWRSGIELPRPRGSFRRSCHRSSWSWPIWSTPMALAQVIPAVTLLRAGISPSRSTGLSSASI